MAARQRKVVGHLPCDPESDQHAQAVGCQSNQALGRASEAFRCFGVGVDLAGHEEEVVADAVQGDASKQHECQVAVITVGEQQVPHGSPMDCDWPDYPSDRDPIAALKSARFGLHV